MNDPLEGGGVGGWVRPKAGIFLGSFFEVNIFLSLFYWFLGTRMVREAMDPPGGTTFAGVGLFNNQDCSTNCHHSVAFLKALLARKQIGPFESFGIVSVSPLQAAVPGG